MVSWFLLSNSLAFHCQFTLRIYKLAIEFHAHVGLAMFHSSLSSHLVQLLGRFGADRRGSVAMTFAITCVPLVLAVGSAIDYSFINRAKTVLDAYADAAALSAVNKSAMQEEAETARTNALNMFKVQAFTLKRGSLEEASAELTDNGTDRSIVINYTAKVPMAFMGLVGIQSITISGTATAVSAHPTYIDFYLLLDNTPSMGVAATPSDVDTMVNGTPDQCAFACHQMDTSPNDYYGLAKNLGVTMRIDVVRSATQQLMDTATETQTVSDQYRMGIYDFGASARQAKLTRISKLTSNLSQAKSDAGSIDLMTVPYSNYAGDTNTDFDSVLSSMNKEISKPGDGSSSSSRQKILFFVSDGVADAANASSCTQPTTVSSDSKTHHSYTRCQEPLTVSYCTALKNRGIKIAVLYTTYLALPTNPWYMTWIDPFNQGPYNPSTNSKIAQDMQSCASPGLYFEVSPTDGISEAMTALFKKVVQQARLTK